MGSFGNWNLTAGNWNVTEYTDQFSKHAKNWAGNAASWSGSVADQANSQARKWLATTTPEPPPGCVSTFGKAFKSLLACVSALPNQYEDQMQQRCNCFFEMRRKIKEADCQGFDHNMTTGLTNIQSEYGQITFDHGVNLEQECKPYYAAWLAEHPEPTLLQLAWDRFLVFAQKHPGAVWFFALLLLALLVLLILMCVRRTRWGRRLASDCYETQKGLSEACVGEYKQCVDDHPECCDDAEKASSRDIVLQDDSDPKAQRSLKVYPDDESDSQEDDGWHGIGYIVNSVAELFAPTEEHEPDHYDMIQEGPSLADIHIQREAEEQGISVVELLQRRRMAEEARQAQLAAEAAMYYNPPYYNVHQTTEEGHQVMAADPQVMQRAAMRSANRQMQPAMPTNTQTPFPSARALGAPSPKGRGRGYGQDLLV